MAQQEMTKEVRVFPSLKMVMKKENINGKDLYTIFKISKISKANCEEKILATFDRNKGMIDFSCFKGHIGEIIKQEIIDVPSKALKTKHVLLKNVCLDDTPKSIEIENIEDITKFNNSSEEKVNE